MPKILLSLTSFCHWPLNSRWLTHFVWRNIKTHFVWRKKHQYNVRKLRNCVSSLILLFFRFFFAFPVPNVIKKVHIRVCPRVSFRRIMFIIETQLHFTWRTNKWVHTYVRIVWYFVPKTSRHDYYQFVIVVFDVLSIFCPIKFLPTYKGKPTTLERQKTRAWDTVRTCTIKICTVLINHTQIK